jgi:hypothetical protein
MVLPEVALFVDECGKYLLWCAVCEPLRVQGNLVSVCAALYLGEAMRAKIA